MPKDKIDLPVRATRKKTKKGFRTIASLNKLGGNQDF